ncbi:MAG: hypothetical protein ABFD89_17740 [Bryobacteraceae bacterium]
MGNWRTWVESLVPGWLQGYWGSRFTGILSLFADATAQGASEALRAPWLKEETSPDDCLHLAGSECRMPRYPNETPATYRARLNGVWEAWEFAGDELAIEGQLHAAGFTTAYVTTDITREGPDGQAAPYWSQFWVHFPPGSGVVVNLTVRLWDGTYLWDGAIDWQPTNLTREQIATMIGIIRQWKPADWVCRALVFDFYSGLWDGSFAWDGSRNWGGTFELELT